MTTTNVARRQRKRARRKDHKEAHHPVDRHVGAAIRALRNKVGISQTALAEAIGVSFQQVQKYERGVNRVSASMLYDIACVLGVPIQLFFEGLPPTTEQSSLTIAAQQLAFAHLYTDGRDGGKLVEVISRLSPKARRALTIFLDQLHTGDAAEGAAVVS